MRPDDFLNDTFKSGRCSSINDTDNLRKLNLAVAHDLVYDRTVSFSLLPHEKLAISRKLNDHVLDLTVRKVHLLAVDASVKPVNAFRDDHAGCDLVFSPELLYLRLFYIFLKLTFCNRLFKKQLGIHIITRVTTLNADTVLITFLRIDEVLCLQKAILFCLLVIVCCV